ncbi:hypothetical protein K7W42_18360 [Deinococcus sp. HMF7604]|uniref:hypothetical protein n=1 Tax=Deinococcus betulae TaxID=2873312 RepID=UPI001CCBDE20|nr:hypothetical protein [Deinococcus betulae]MBZ9752807.1 hypothetical protein [Deinococcus betulae]
MTDAAGSPSPPGGGKKNWKTALQKSGLPLEHSVAGVLKRLGLKVQVEYSYLRRNERSEDITFSVDLRAVHRDDEKGLVLSLLVECKYRTRGTQWIFVPNEDEAPFNQHLPTYFKGIDLFTQSSVSTLGAYDLYPQELMVHRGLQLAEAGNVAPKGPNEAAAQLRYASLEQSLEWTVQRVSDVKHFGADLPRLPAVGVCLIVTTAELRVLKPQLTLEAFEAARHPDEVSVPQPYVFLDAPPDGAFQRHATRRIQEELSDAALVAQGFGDVLEPLRASSAVTDLNSFILGESRLEPRVFVVVQYRALEEVIAQILKDSERLHILDKAATWEIDRRK